MYINIGNNVMIKDDEIVGIFDIDGTTVSKRTREFLNRAERENIVENISPDIPKTFIVCEKKGVKKVYLTQPASGTLLKRTGYEENL